VTSNFINLFLGYNLSLSRLREIGNANNPDDRYIMYDSQISRFVEGLENICRIFKLQINIYTLTRDNNFKLSDIYPLDRFSKIDNNEYHVVSILNNGFHFELIIKSNELNIDLQIE